MRRIALVLAAIALSTTLSACAGTTYVEHRFSGDPRAALAMERAVAKIALDCPSGASVNDARVHTRYRVDTDRERQPERTEIRGRTVRACVR